MEKKVGKERKQKSEGIKISPFSNEELTKKVLDQDSVMTSLIDIVDKSINESSGRIDILREETEMKLELYAREMNEKTREFHDKTVDLELRVDKIKDETGIQIKKNLKEVQGKISGLESRTDKNYNEYKKTTENYEKDKSGIIQKLESIKMEERAADKKICDLEDKISTGLEK